MRTEADVLNATGTSAELVLPDAATLEAIGINRMDASRRGVTTHAGIAQGRALASRLAGSWAKAAA